jgi:tetratricopeptide (TPR) repeat protein
MRISMRVPSALLLGCVLATALPAAWANGGGSMSMPSTGSSREQTPEDKAKALYNQGVREVKKADKYQKSAAEATDAHKKESAQKEAQEYYSSALPKFKQATEVDPKLAEAWNYLGYTNRHVGNYDVALAAYQTALTLKPGYPDALEYRGEAFLGLNRVTDAQQAYLDLFSGNRELAGKLLTAIKGWVETQRASSSGDASAVNALDKWIQERTTIASQTAALTRAGAAASWN